MTTYYESKGEYLMRKGMDPYEQVDLQAEKIIKLEKEIERLCDIIETQEDAIKTFHAEIERLRAALEEIAEARSVEDEWCGDIAREALKDD